MTDTSQQQAPLPRHAANMPSAASKSKQDEMVTLLSPSQQNEDFFFLLAFVSWWISLCIVQQRLAIPLTSLQLALGAIRALEGGRRDEWHRAAHVLPVGATPGPCLCNIINMHAASCCTAAFMAVKWQYLHFLRSFTCHPAWQLRTRPWTATHHIHLTGRLLRALAVWRHRVKLKHQRIIVWCDFGNTVSIYTHLQVCTNTRAIKQMRVWIHCN